MRQSPGRSWLGVEDEVTGTPARVKDPRLPPESLTGVSRQSRLATLPELGLSLPTRVGFIASTSPLSRIWVPRIPWICLPGLWEFDWRIPFIVLSPKLKLTRTPLVIEKLTKSHCRSYFVGQCHAKSPQARATHLENCNHPAYKRHRQTGGLEWTRTDQQLLLYRLQDPPRRCKPSIQSHLTLQAPKRKSSTQTWTSTETAMAADRRVSPNCFPRANFRVLLEARHLSQTGSFKSVTATTSNQAPMDT